MKKKDRDSENSLGLSAHAEFVPVVSKEDERFLLQDNPDIPDELPVLPLRDNVLFPGVILPIAAGRKPSVALLKYADKHEMLIGVITQCDDTEAPTRDDLFDTGVVARVLKVFDLPDGTTMGVLQGVTRFKLNSLRSEKFYMATIDLIPEPSEIENARKFRTNASLIRRHYANLVKRRSGNDPISSGVKNITSDRILVNYVASHLEVQVSTKEAFLEADSYEIRAQMVLSVLADVMEEQSVSDDIQSRARKEMERQQREYFLNQQMRIIQDELGGSPVEQDMEELRKRATKKRWSAEVNAIFEKELSKLGRAAVQSPDYTVQYNYLDLMLDLPWNEYSNDNLDLSHARKALDKDHYGIEKVKERILEYIAVLGLRGDMKSPILCLVGPPGTGKTSLGKSIAKALGRKYVRIALGGLHDESEVRGHRRTYIGAMPGRIIQGFKRAGTSNPVFVLDEIDKVQSNTMHGDPTSALLEVLDPEQNNAFHDNYLDVDFDLSKSLFIATANSLSTIQPALLDRMEIIDLNGYILEEKLEIAKNYLVPRQLKEHGFRRGAITIAPTVLTEIINNYTREAGVRQLEHTIAKVIRRRAVKAASYERFSKAVSAKELPEILGLPIHHSERRGKAASVGVVTGLAWTSVGGEILFIESSTSKGKGTLSLTGNLGDVMKESATLAYEYLKANAHTFGVNYDNIENSNLHIHVPEGATPKDGPSAGITMFVAMVSAFTHRKVRPEVAMTGEITLRGAVTPVGGIKEKILAAKRADITDIVLSEENRRDIEDIKESYLQGLTFHYIKEMHEALPLALVEE